MNRRQDLESIGPQALHITRFGAPSLQAHFNMNGSRGVLRRKAANFVRRQKHTWHIDEAKTACCLFGCEAAPNHQHRGTPCDRAHIRIHGVDLDSHGVDEMNFCSKRVAPIGSYRNRNTTRNMCGRYALDRGVRHPLRRHGPDRPHAASKAQVRQISRHWTPVDFDCVSAREHASRRRHRSHCNGSIGLQNGCLSCTHPAGNVSGRYFDLGKPFPLSIHLARHQCGRDVVRRACVGADPAQRI